MAEPALTVLGVYRPVINEATWHQQCEITGDDQATREHFRTLVLIEAVVEGLSAAFDFSKFGRVPHTTRFSLCGIAIRGSHG